MKKCVIGLCILLTSAALLGARQASHEKPAERGKYGTASGADQVLSAVYDPANNSLRVSGNSGGGTVTSVGLSMPGAFTVTGSPITASGTLSVGWGAQPIGIANGGTGQTTSGGAFNALAPPTVAGGLLYGTGLNTYGNLALGASGQCLGSNGAALVWTTCGTGTSLTLAGDLSGSLSTQVVVGLQGHSVSATAPASGQVLEWNGAANAWTPTTLPSFGAVASVGLSAPSIFNTTGSPITGSGTLTLSLAAQPANTIFAGPASGVGTAPVFRSLSGADLPSINLAAGGNGGVAGVLGVGNGGTGITSVGSSGQCLGSNGTAMVWTSCGGGGGAALALQTNGASNSGQSVLNLVNGTNITFANTSGGIVTASVTGTLAPALLPNPAGDVTGSYAATAVTGLHFGSTGIPLSATAPASGQCLQYNGTNILGGACGSGAPGGATMQLEYNNAGSFGGTSNLNYSSATGQLALNQLANGDQTLYGTRATDTAPAGNFIDFQNAAKSADLFKVDTLGNVTATSFTSTSGGPASITGSEGTCSGAAAGKDILCAGDSTTHTIQASVNGGSFAPITLGPSTAPVSGDCVKWGANWTLADQGAPCGSGGTSSITLQSNGTNNASQTALNLVPGTGISITNSSGGNVTITATGGGGGGVSVVYATSTSETAASTPVLTMVTPSANHLYRFSLTILQTAVASSTGCTLSTYTSWTDAVSGLAVTNLQIPEIFDITRGNGPYQTVALTSSSGNLPLAAHVSPEIISAKASDPVRYFVAYAGSCGSPSYTVQPVLEQLQ